MKTESYSAREYRRVKARVDDLTRQDRELTTLIESLHAKLSAAAASAARRTAQTKFNEACQKRAFIRSQLSDARNKLADAERNVRAEASNIVARQFKSSVSAEFAAIVGG